MLIDEVREALKKQTKWCMAFYPLNYDPELIRIYWERHENDLWARTDHYVISFEVDEEAQKIYKIIIEKYLDTSSREKPGYIKQKDVTHPFKIPEPNDVDTVVARIKKEIPFETEPTQKSAVFTVWRTL
ncbi:hypothetical protein [Nostoc sp.]|uniref:hypothetical protein n=1 Tax=Nostoc sp. TaxID=1180 RepID=UPI002FFC97F9